MNKNNKLAYIIFLLTGFVLLLGGCGKEQTGSNASAKADMPDVSAEQKTVADIYQEITDAVSLESPVLMEDDFIMNYYGIDSALLEEYVFSASEDATKAETVIVLKAADAGSLEDLKECIQAVADEKKDEMKDYIPEQFAIVEKSKVQTKGNYVWLVISEQSDAILEIIEKNILG